MLALQKPSPPPTQTPLIVAVLPSTMRPSAVRGAGWLASLVRAGLLLLLTSGGRRLILRVALWHRHLHAVGGSLRRLRVQR